MSEAPVSRKRSRAAPSDTDAPPPFSRPRSRLKRAHGAHGVESSRLGPSAAMASLAVITHARLAARDFAGAAAALSTLLARYRRPGRTSWYFPREVAAAGGCIARRTGSATGFLAAIARDGLAGARTEAAAGAPLTRAIALVEAALDEIAAGRARQARDLLASEAALPAFAHSCLVHAYLGLLSLALAGERAPDRDVLLADAKAALTTAARLDPSAYIYAHAAAAAEVAANPQDPRAGLDLVRAFAGSAKCNAFAQAALLKALRLLPRPPRQEVAETARLLAAADPLSQDALNALREAAAWNWEVEPPVGRGEVAAAAAAVVEHGAGDVKAWVLLGECLAECTDGERIAFWSGAGRDRWWPSHFFRQARVNADRMIPGLASAKAVVAELLDGSIPYVALVGRGPTRGQLC